MSRYLSGPMKILDYGCGTGAFLKNSNNGYKTFGYDINPYSAFRDKNVVGESWDAVTMWDVLEHIPDPHRFITGMDTKYLMVLTPDATGLHGKLAGWKHFKVDEHQHYFTKESITAFMERCGFRVMEMNHDEGELRDPRHPQWLVTVVGEHR